MQTSEGFKSSKSKDAIRSSYDLELVRSEFEYHGKPLTYFGLPGWRMLDIFAWRDYFGAYYAFEENPLFAVMMILTAFKYQVEANLTLFEEEIDTALSKNISRDGLPIPFGFEVANLDYEGGIIYKDIKEDSKRIVAIERLFEGQGKVKKDFLLLLTVNVRKNDKGEIDTVVQRILRDNGITDNDLLSSLASQPVAQKYKVYIPYMIKRIAESRHFDCRVHHPIRYSGGDGKSVMVHFAFTLRYNRKISAISPSKQTLSEVLSLELFEAKDGRILIY